MLSSLKLRDVLGVLGVVKVSLCCFGRVDCFALVALRDQDGLACRFDDQVAQGRRELFLADELLHRGDAVELALVEHGLVITGSHQGLGHLDVVGILPVAPALDELPAVELFARQSFLQGVGLDVAGPFLDLLGAPQDLADLLVREERGALNSSFASSRLYSARFRQTAFAGHQRHQSPQAV